MVNSFLRLVQVNPGFNTRKLLMAEIRLSSAKHVEILENDMKRVTPLVDTLYKQVLERLEKDTGVESVTLEGEGECTLKILGQPDPASGEQREAMFTEVGPAFVRTMQVPLLKGRTLTPRDNEHAPWVAMVNEAMVRRYFPGKGPVGKLLVGDLWRFVGTQRHRGSAPRDCRSHRRHPAPRSGRGCGDHPVDTHRCQHRASAAKIPSRAALKRGAVAEP